MERTEELAFINNSVRIWAAFRTIFFRLERRTNNSRLFSNFALTNSTNQEKLIISYIN
jgi:hypothetical protein